MSTLTINLRSLSKTNMKGGRGEGREASTPIVNLHPLTKQIWFSKKMS